MPTSPWIAPATSTYRTRDGCRVVKMDTAGRMTTVAGTGSCGYSGDGGPATQARLDHPYQIDIDRAGNLYIAD